MIVTCHFFQAYDNDWAYVLNTGVQIFLLISGFLYGYTGVTDIPRFYSGRIRKVYLPYILWTMIISFLLIAFAYDHFNIRVAVAQILMVGRMDGQSHLWFIPVLFICYLILPVFTLIRNRTLSLSALLVFVLILSGIYAITGEADYLWIMTYFIGFILGMVPNICKALFIPIVILVAFMLLDTPVLELFTDKSFAGRAIHILSALGILCLCIVVADVMRGKSGKYPPLLLSRKHPSWLGKFEFEVYLVHQTFLIGPLALVYITDNRIFNIIICILAIGVTTLLFCILKKKFLDIKFRLPSKIRV